MTSALPAAGSARDGLAYPSASHDPSSSSFKYAVKPSGQLDDSPAFLPYPPVYADTHSGADPSSSRVSPTSSDGKDAIRVDIACSICRKRKTRCDGVKPRCGNCVRRQEDCNFESIPKRRGPDRKPGTRIRTVYSKRLLLERGGVLPPRPEKRERCEPLEGSAVKRRKISTRRKSKWSPTSATGSSQEGDGHGRSLTESSPSTSDTVNVSDLRVLPRVKTEVELFLSEEHSISPTDTARDDTGASDDDGYALADDGTHRSETEYMSAYDKPAWQEETSKAYITELTSEDDYGDESTSDIAPEPSMDFNRRTWWDTLLDTYRHDRLLSMTAIQTDLAFLFSISPYFISFINVPLFWGTFLHPEARDRMQPSLVISALALTTFMRSSELEGGVAGRRRALQLAEVARSCLQASLNAGWVDPSLAQAAFILTLFEMCPHPEYSYQRLTSSYWALDSIVATLGLPSMDAQDTDAVVFAPGFVPSVSRQHGKQHERAGTCSCSTLALCATSRTAQRLTPLWSQTPAWDPEWTEAEIRKEESRRLCWNTLNLESGHTSVAISFGYPTVDFHCTRPENYALLFPGEMLARSSKFTFVHHPRDSVWSVYGRLALLYGSCWRMMDSDADAGEKTQFAYNAWLETLELEDILNSHVCYGERSTLFQGREFLFKIRVLISRDYRNYFPFPETGIDLAFHHKKAEQWLSHQADLAYRLMEGLNGVTGMGANDLRMRPFLLWYFALQSQRCLSFHAIDPALTIALDVAAAWLMPIDYLTQIWPCENMDEFVGEIRSNLASARALADVEPGSQAKLSFYLRSRPT